MKKMGVVLVLFSLLTIVGCKNKKQNQNKDFIDVAAYLKGQLSYLDTVPHAFLKLTDRDSLSSDSSYLTKQQVREITLSFMPPELEIKNFTQKFEETSFADATLQTITITYNSIDKSNSIDRVDVYVNPQNGDISKLYIIQSTQKLESTVKKQLLWKHNKGFTVITTITAPKKEDQTVTEKVIWQ